MTKAWFSMARARSSVSQWSTRFAGHAAKEKAGNSPAGYASYAAKEKAENSPTR